MWCKVFNGWPCPTTMFLLVFYFLLFKKLCKFTQVDLQCIYCVCNSVAISHKLYAHEHTQKKSIQYTLSVSVTCNKQEVLKNISVLCCETLISQYFAVGRLTKLEKKKNFFFFFFLRNSLFSCWSESSLYIKVLQIDRLLRRDNNSHF